MPVDSVSIELLEASAIDAANSIAVSSGADSDIVLEASRRNRIADTAHRVEHEHPTHTRRLIDSSCSRSESQGILSKSAGAHAVPSPSSCPRFAEDRRAQSYC